MVSVVVMQPALVDVVHVVAVGDEGMVVRTLLPVGVIVRGTSAHLY